MVLPEILTPPEIGKLLRVSPEKVIGWIRDTKELVGIDVSQRNGRPQYRIRREDLDAFLKAREVQSKPKPVTRRRVKVDTPVEWF